jgi:hypothetical protein
MAQTDGGSRRLESREAIQQWIAERRAALSALQKQDKLAQRRVQLTLDLDEEVAA